MRAGRPPYEAPVGKAFVQSERAICWLVGWLIRGVFMGWGGYKWDLKHTRKRRPLVARCASRLTVGAR